MNCENPIKQTNETRRPELVSGPQKAFTLAEVLITLAIIGVVAALTIPTVVRNYQKQATVTKLKKAYTTLANTTNLAIADNGPIETWQYYLYTQIDPVSAKGGSEHFANNYLIPYLKVSKNCGVEKVGKCKFEYANLADQATKKNLSDYCDYARFYLSDGTFILVVGPTSDSVSTHAIIWIDVDGQGGKNVLGHDIFVFNYYLRVSKAAPYYNYINGKFVPIEYWTTREFLMSSDSGYGRCNKNAATKNNSGYYCSAVIMKDGWQIKDDYPW